MWNVCVTSNLSSKDVMAILPLLYFLLLLSLDAIVSGTGVLKKSPPCIPRSQTQPHSLELTFGELVKKNGSGKDLAIPAAIWLGAQVLRGLLLIHLL